MLRLGLFSLLVYTLLTQYPGFAAAFGGGIGSSSLAEQCCFIPLDWLMNLAGALSVLLSF